MKKLVLSIAVLAMSQAHADFHNGPNPYDSSFGFDTPTEASWGWARGDADTLYAEWDIFTNDNGTTHQPDVATAGDTAFIHNIPSLVTGTNNIYAWASDQTFSITIDNGELSNAGGRTVALQVETWGETLIADGFNLKADSQTFTASSATQTHASRVNSSFGEVDLVHWLIVWNDIDVASFNDLVINGAAKNHASMTQFALDIGTASEVPVPAAAWLFGSALLGLAGFKRK